MSFIEERFPENIEYSSSGGPMYSTDVVMLQSGHEQRNSNWSVAKHEYTIKALKNGTDVQAVLDFFHAMQGRLHGFRFKDWADFNSNDQHTAISSVDQPMVGTVDGVNKVFQCSKVYTVGAASYSRLIDKVVSGTFTCAKDTVTVPPANYTFNANTGKVTFSTAPTPGTVVTCGYEFDVPVRFDADKLDLSHLAFDTVTLNLPIVEIRVV